MDVDTDPNEVSVTQYEDDPDGADRGGFHQETQTLTLDGTKLTVLVEVSDYYEDRIGELPEPVATTKDEAKTYVTTLLTNLRRKMTDLEAFLLNLEKVETVKVAGAESSDDDEDDEDEDEDEDDDD